MLKIAVAKGRIAEKTQKILDKAGAFANIIDTKSRKLIFVDEERQIEFILVKPADVPSYVENAAVDIGIIGKDVLMESECKSNELLDLGFGACKMVVAGPPALKDNYSGITKVASKYPKITRHFFTEKKMHVQIIKLEGSIELAPLVGLSDVIVDLVESGKTLEENGLVVFEEICSISARLVVNKVSYKLKNKEINNFIELSGFKNL